MLLLDHCIESIRLSLTCQSDTTVLPFVWDTQGNSMNANFDTLHTCRNFSKFQEWAFSRSLDKAPSATAHVVNGVVVDLGPKMGDMPEHIHIP